MFVNYNQQSSFQSLYKRLYDDYFGINIYPVINGYDIAFRFINAEGIDIQLIEDEIECMELDLTYDYINQAIRNSTVSIIQTPPCLFKKDKSIQVIQYDSTGSCIKDERYFCICKRCGDAYFNDLPIVTDYISDFYESYKLIESKTENYLKFISESIQYTIENNLLNENVAFVNPCGYVYVPNCGDKECNEIKLQCCVEDLIDDIKNGTNKTKCCKSFKICSDSLDEESIKKALCKKKGFVCSKLKILKDGSVFCIECNCITGKPNDKKCLGQRCCNCKYVDCVKLSPLECTPCGDNCKPTRIRIKKIHENTIDNCIYLINEIFYQIDYISNSNEVCYSEVITNYFSEKKDCNEIIKCLDRCINVIDIDYDNDCILVEKNYRKNKISMKEVDCQSNSDCDSVLKIKDSETGKEKCYCLKIEPDFYDKKTKKICCKGIVNAVKPILENRDEQIKHMKYYVINKIYNRYDSLDNPTYVHFVNEDVTLLNFNDVQRYDVSDEEYEFIINTFKEAGYTCVNLDINNIVKLRIRRHNSFYTFHYFINVNYHVKKSCDKNCVGFFWSDFYYLPREEASKFISVLYSDETSTHFYINENIFSTK